MLKILMSKKVLNVSLLNHNSKMCTIKSPLTAKLSKQEHHATHFRHCVVKVPQAIYDEVCVMHKAELHALQFYLQSQVCDVSSVISIEKSNGLGKGELEPLVYTKTLSGSFIN